VVMFTDGVTEARNARDEEFGEQRLLACISTGVAPPPGVLLRRIFEAVREHCQQAEQSDDVTVTVTRFGSDAGPTPV
jgi:sigma-B regulation protein RsbU (phosphoserine phosphatase)